MRCIKCFSEMFGPDFSVDMNEKYLSIDRNKYPALNIRELNRKKIEEEKISFIRSSPIYDMKIKLLMCCVECGYTTNTGSSIQIKSELNIEKHFKGFLRRKF